MEFLKMVFGFTLIVFLAIIFFKNLKRKGLINALIRFDTLTGLVVGFYLAITSFQSLIS